MIETYITSAIEGRLRIRHPFLMDKDLVESVFAFLKEQPKLESINVNPRTGSILIEYDYLKVTQAEIINDLEEYVMSYCIENGYLEELLKFEENANATSDVKISSCEKFNINKAKCHCLVNRSMLVFLASSIGLGLLNRMRGHVLTSGIFAALSVVHLYIYRKRF